MNFSNLTVHLEYFGDISIYLGVGIQIIFAIFLGGLVGFDRELKMKAAGIRTNILICLGATLYTTMSLINLAGANTMIDPNRISAQIVSGIGFLGAGAIIQGRGSVTGMTTAATIWVVAAIGYTIGIGFPIVATLFTISVYAILRIANPFYRLLEKRKGYKHSFIEILSFGSVTQEIQQILNLEQIEGSSLHEDYHNELKNEIILTFFTHCHPRALDRIAHEIKESIKVQKVNYRFIEEKDKPTNGLSLKSNS